jgi:FkbM family methyltransferase
VGIFAMNLTSQSAQEINGTIVSVRIMGQNVSFFVADETDLIQKEHFHGKFYESEELKIISEFFPAGGIFVDIGANVGNHTVFVARFLSPLKIIVIEPNPATFEILKANIALNRLDGRVDVSYLGIGLSNTSARAVAITPAGNLGGTRLHLSEEQSGLRVVPGDALLFGHRIDFLKIDVEGMEIDVLEGLKRTIAEQRPRIFIEVDNCNVEKFVEWTAINNYYIVASNSGRTFWSASPTSTPGYANFMLIPEVRH